MSTWISKGAFALALALLVSACVPSASSAPGKAVRSKSYLGGAAVAAGPAGYCIDERASRDNPGGAFVLFGTCAALSGVPGAGQPASPALLTASIALDNSETPTSDRFAAMSRFFQSTAGRAALSRSGRPETVTVTRAFSGNGVLYAKISDVAGAREGLDPGYWRAIFGMRGMLVTLSVMSHSSRPADDATLRRTLDSFIRAMRAANSGTGAESL
ncbi:MAG: hypothetical protein KDE03_00835 [Rhodobacteraceae bacterium]|nr:hypothetical protein [Paracoccaceae bacterium]